MLLFHTHDEPGRQGWQSGLVYADGTPKTSLEPVREAMKSAEAAEIGPCPVESSVSAAFTTTSRTISFRCERACTYRARLLRLPRRSLLTVATGKAAPGKRVNVQLTAPAVAPGWQQLSISFVDAARPGRPVERFSTPFVVRVSSPPRPLPDAVATTVLAPRFWLEP
jgi:hypothetical protein